MKINILLLLSTLCAACGSIGTPTGGIKTVYRCLGQDAGATLYQVGVTSSGDKWIILELQGHTYGTTFYAGGDTTLEARQSVLDTPLVTVSLVNGAAHFACIASQPDCHAPGPAEWTVPCIKTDY